MRTGVVRVCMAMLGAVHAWWGVWARVWPEHFFTHFPGLGHHWTVAYPPYNDHLVTDLGATFLTLAFLLLAGAAVDDRGVRALALLGVALFSALHLSFHATQHGAMTGVDYAQSVVALALGVVLPAVLLVVDRLPRRGRASAE